MGKIVFIVNPTAGGGKALKLISTIEEIMDRTDIENQIVLTKGPNDAVDLTKQKIQEGYETIVAVGGDGTINEIARAILECGKGKLGILPSGTGNDMARSLGIDFNPAKAIDTIIKGQEKDVDVGFVNDRLFVNIASVGFDAETVMNTENVKKKIRFKIAYIIGVLITLIRFKYKKVELEIDDIGMEKDITLIAVGNGRYYGGGLEILPMAVLDDGYFYICMVNKISSIKLLFLFPTILMGKHINIKKYVEVYKAKKVKIRIKNKAYLNVDGEIYDMKKETLFQMDNRRLPILVKGIKGG